MSTRPYRDFDLPTRHLTGERHFIPPKARDEAEIERRRAQRPGTLLTEAQHKGVVIASRILAAVHAKDSLNFVAETLAPASLNTAWYLFGQDAPTMRRRLKLEVLGTDDPEQRPTAYMLHQSSVEDLQTATAYSAELVGATRAGLESTGRLRRELGRVLGHGALTLSCVPLGDTIGYEAAALSNFDLQAIARQRGLHALQQARVLTEAIGTPPSIAQLADPISDLSVYWQRNAPNEALEAYETAVQTSG